MALQFFADLPDTAGRSGTHLKLAVDSTGTLHLAYIALNASNQVVLRHAVGIPQLALIRVGGFFTDVSYHWTHVDVLALPAGLPDVQFDLAVDSQDTPHICFESTREDDHVLVPELLHLALDGSMPDHVFDFSSMGGFGLAMTITKDDAIHIALSGEVGLRHAVQNRNASAFQVEPVANSPNALDRFVALSIAVDAAGVPRISFIHQVTDPNGVVLQAALMYAQRTGSPWILDTVDPGPVVNSMIAGTAAGTNSLTLDANGLPHIAYFARSLGIRHATWTGGVPFLWSRSPTGFGESVDPAGQPAPAAVLVDRNNVPFIAYQALTAAGTTELRFATRTMLGNFATTTADPSFNSGWAISAGIDPVGRPQIGCGFSSSANVPPAIKHVFAVDLSEIPFPRPHPHKPVKILRRSDQL